MQQTYAPSQTRPSISPLIKREIRRHFCVHLIKRRRQKLIRSPESVQYEKEVTLNMPISQRKANPARIGTAIYGVCVSTGSKAKKRALGCAQRRTDGTSPCLRLTRLPGTRWIWAAASFAMYRIHTGRAWKRISGSRSINGSIAPPTWFFFPAFSFRTFTGTQDTVWM